MIALDDDEAVERVIVHVRRLKAEHPRAGMKAFILPMEKMI